MPKTRLGGRETWAVDSIECPHCGRVQHDDVWEYETDDVWTCPHCEERSTLIVGTSYTFTATPATEGAADAEG